MENIFARFINFIKSMFRNEKQKQIPEKIEVTVQQEEKSNFIDELKSHTKEEKDTTLLKLQKQYESNEIDLSAMSNEQVHELNSLYSRQVSELKEILNNKKSDLSKMKSKIENYSADM